MEKLHKKHGLIICTIYHFLSKNFLKKNINVDYVKNISFLPSGTMYESTYLQGFLSYLFILLSHFRL